MITPVLAAVAVLVLVAFLLPTGLFTKSLHKVCACCGRSEPEVAKVIVGPGLGICDRCVHAATDVLTTPGPVWYLSCTAPSKQPRSADRCSFCGKDRDYADGLVVLSRGAICRGCVSLCAEILAEDASVSNREDR